MDDQTLLTYVTTERGRGVSDSAIREALLDKGWNREDVAKALMGTAQIASPRTEFSFSYLYEGRLGRMQYFINSCLYFILLFFVFLLVDEFFIYAGIGDTPLFFVVVVIYLLALPLALSLTVRRIHDMGWSGLWILFFFVPLLGLFFPFVVLLKKGTDGENAYGSRPLNRGFVATLLNN